MTTDFNQTSHAGMKPKQGNPLWERLVAEYRQVCMLRRQRKFLESNRIVNGALAQSIAEWGRSFEGDVAAKRARLDDMFQVEQKRVDDAWMVQEMFAAKMREDLIPVLCARVQKEARSQAAQRPVETRPTSESSPLNQPAPRNPSSRVLFDDLSSVIDLVQLEETVGRGVFPLTALTP